MQSKLHENVVYPGVEVLLLVSMVFLLAIPKSFILVVLLLRLDTLCQEDNERWYPLMIV